MHRDSRADIAHPLGARLLVRQEDQDTLKAHLVYAPRVRAVVLQDATHFAHLDRPERGRDQLIRELFAFLEL